MIIIQRKSDGKYFKGNDTWYDRDKQWTDNVEKARVYTSESKARHYNARLFSAVLDPLLRGDDKWITPWETRKKIAQAEMDKNYRFIPVEIRKVVREVKNR